jgi:hypothetical protein
MGLPIEFCHLEFGGTPDSLALNLSPFAIHPRHFNLPMAVVHPAGAAKPTRE